MTATLLTWNMLHKGTFISPKFANLANGIWIGSCLLTCGCETRLDAYVPCEDCMCAEICIQANLSRICGLTKAKQGYNQLPCHPPFIVQTKADNIAIKKHIWKKSTICEAMSL